VGGWVAARPPPAAPADAADGVGGLSIGSALKASAPAFVPGRRPH
jgi:hypothetical protein